MIASFNHPPTERLWKGEKPAELPSTILKTALRKLTQLEAATTLDDLKIPPGNRLEHLVGDRIGQLSIRINIQYRVCFRWKDGNAHDVEITDYH